MLIATLCILLSTILTTQPSAAKKLTDLFPRDGLCGLSTKERLDTLRSIQEAADRLDAGFVTVPQCGAGLWLPIANFDVTGTDTECPPGWTFTDVPTRGCFGENSNSGAGGCDVATFPTNEVLYNKVCGRITGRATGILFGFIDILQQIPTFDTTVTQFDGVVPADGVTLTHSTPAEHIWTFAASIIDGAGNIACPCDPDLDNNAGAVEFADSNNYFCDAADSEAEKTLWAGDCGTLETDAPECCNVNGPPFFVSTLTSPTSANVDARLCLDGNAGLEGLAEALFIQRMELYVQ